MIKALAAKLMSMEYDNEIMSNGSNTPVVVGLATGVTFIVLMAFVVSSTSIFPARVELKEEYGDLEGQQRAIDILLTDPKVRAFVNGKELKVWAYGANFPQASLNEGICDKNECTLIGIQKWNTDGSLDCSLKTFVNVETRQLDSVAFGGKCDDRRG